MNLTPTQKTHLEELLKAGDELAAVRYLQNNLGLSAEEALRLTEKLDKTVEEDDDAKLKSLMKKRGLRAINDSKMGKWIGGIFLFFGLVMLSVSCYIFYSNYTFSQKAVAVEGKVIDFTTSYSTDDDGNSTLMYSAVFEYEYNGKMYEHESDVSSSSQDYDDGEIVEILIDPDSPRKALVNTFWERWFAIILLGFMGTAFTGGGFLALKMG